MKSIVSELVAGDTTVSERIVARDFEVIFDFAETTFGAENLDEKVEKQAVIVTRIYRRLVAFLCQSHGLKNSGLPKFMLLTCLQDYLNWFGVENHFECLEEGCNAVLDIMEDDSFERRSSKFVAEWFRQWKKRAQSKPQTSAFPRREKIEFDVEEKILEDLCDAALETLVKRGFICGTVPAVNLILYNVLRHTRSLDTVQAKMKVLSAVCREAREIAAEDNITFYEE